MQFSPFPRQESNSGVRWLWVSVVMVSLTLFTSIPSAPARAAQTAGSTAPVYFNSTMETLYQALLDVANGTYVMFGALAVPPQSTPMTPAITMLDNDLKGGPGPHMPVDEFLQRIIDGTSGGEPWADGYLPNFQESPGQVAADRVQNPAVPLNLLYQALSGGAGVDPALTPLQHYIPYSFLEPCPDCTPPFTHVASLNAGIPGPISNQGYLYSRAAKLAAYLVAGSHDVALRTLKNSLMGAQPALNTLYILSTPGKDLGWTQASGQPFPDQCHLAIINYMRFSAILRDAHGGQGGLDNWVETYYTNSANLPQYMGAVIDAAIAGGPQQRNLLANLLAYSFSDDPGTGGRYGVYSYYWDQSDLPGNADLVPAIEGLGPPYNRGCLDAVASQWAFNATPTPIPGAVNPPADPPPPADQFTEIEIPDPNNNPLDTNMDDASASTEPQDPFIEDDPSGPEENDCEVESDHHPLTDDFKKDPCTWTRDNQSVGFAQDHQAGWYFMDYLASWWEKEYIPALKEMTGQMTAQIIDQTRQLGTAKDANMLNKAAKSIQKLELQARKDNAPNEKSCAVASFSPVAATTTRVSNVVAQGFMATTSKEVGAGPSKLGTDGASADAPNPRGKKAHILQRLNDYCAYSNDPDGNAGVNLCNNEIEDTKIRSNAPDESAPADEGVQVAAEMNLGVQPNSDIDVEGFMFQDTISFGEPANRDTAALMMSNIVNPFGEDEIPPEVVSQTKGVQSILDRQHVKSIKSVVSAVVGKIFSSRAAVPLPPVYMKQVTADDLDQAMEPETAAPGTTPTPGSGGDLEAYLNKVCAKESRCRPAEVNGHGYMGAFQMGEAEFAGIGAIKNQENNSDKNFISYAINADPPNPNNVPNTYVHTGFRLIKNCQACGNGNGCKCTKKVNARFRDYTWLPSSGFSNRGQYLGASLAQQKVLYKKYLRNTWKQVESKGLTVHIGKVKNGVLITASGLLGSAHLLGAGGTRKMINSGGGTDAYGTSGWTYMKYLNGYDISEITGNSFIPDTPSVPESGDLASIDPNAPDAVPADTATVEVNAAKLISGIREKAGVPLDQISDTPSYNEIMRAMTKERFFDPEYYTNLADNLGAIKQEQASVNAYISIQWQDIYKLQEQINALLAAKASMQLNDTYLPDRMEVNQTRK